MSGEAIAGHGYSQWRVYQLRGVLNHFGIRPKTRIVKSDLWNALEELIQRRQIPERQLLEIRDGPAEVAQPPPAKRRRTRRHQHADPGTATAECIVCFDNFDPDEKRGLIATTACTHAPDICSPCFAKSITSQMATKAWDLLSCPSCNTRLGFGEIKAYATLHDFTR